MTDDPDDIPHWEEDKIYRIKIRGNTMIVECTDPKTGKVEIKRYKKESPPQ